MKLSILSVMGLPVKISILFIHVFLSLNVFILANTAYLENAAGDILSGSTLFAKVIVYRFSEWKGLDDKKICVHRYPKM